MDFLDRYLGYEQWTTRHIISRCQELSNAQLHQSFDMGHGTVHETLGHMIRNIEGWTALMRGVPKADAPPIPDNAQAYLARFDPAMADFGDFAKGIVAANRLDDTFTDIYDEPPVKKPYGGAILHVLTHTTVHRWETQHMLQRL